MDFAVLYGLLSCFFSVLFSMIEQIQIIEDASSLLVKNEKYKENVQNNMNDDYYEEKMKMGEAAAPQDPKVNEWTLLGLPFIPSMNKIISDGQICKNGLSSYQLEAITYFKYYLNREKLDMGLTYRGLSFDILVQLSTPMDFEWFQQVTSLRLPRHISKQQLTFMFHSIGQGWNLTAKQVERAMISIHNSTAYIFGELTFGVWDLQDKIYDEAPPPGSVQFSIVQRILPTIGLDDLRGISFLYFNRHGGGNKNTTNEEKMKGSICALAEKTLHGYTYTRYTGKLPKTITSNRSVPNLWSLARPIMRSTDIANVAITFDSFVEILTGK